MDLEMTQNNEEKENETIPSKRSSKNTFAEAMATRDRRIKESKLGFRTLNAMAKVQSLLRERERERERERVKRETELRSWRMKWKSEGTI